MALTTQTQLGTHQFYGPHPNANTLPAQSGVYVITRITNGHYEIIDVGESYDIAQRISNHDRMDQWKRASNNMFHVWTLLANETQRMQIEKAHRTAYSPICGIR